MFEATLEAKLKKIFDFKKSTFDLPGESEEQECIFIKVTKCHSTIKEKLSLARVEGSFKVYGNSEKMPYGYFAKKIQAAEVADTVDFFFYDIEENAGTYRNISDRSLSFIYFFSSQYDPEVGTITSINLEVDET